MAFDAQISSLAYNTSLSPRFNKAAGDFPYLLSPQSNQAFQTAMAAIPESMRRWVFGLVEATGAHPAMAFSTLLSGMAACAHGRYMVLRPNGKREPLGLFMMILSDRTTGKSSVHREVYDPIKAWQKKNYRAALLGRANSHKCDAAEEASQTASQVRSHRVRDYLLEDTNKRGLLEALDGIGESVSIASDEGDTILRSPLFRLNLSTLNKLDDGDCSIGMGRGKHDAIKAMDSSVNCLVMVQPSIAMEFRELHGKHARDIGFDARCLYACIPRVTPSPTSSTDQLALCLEDYYMQADAHLSARMRQLDAGEFDREVLSLSEDAESLWWHLLEEHKQRGGYGYEHVQDAVNRMPQHALRISGNLHAYSGDPGPIPSKTLNAAWLIARWFLAEFAFAFPPEPPTLPPVMRAPKPSLHEKQLQRQQDDLRTVVECVRLLCKQLDVESVHREKVFVRSGLYNARYRTAEMRAIDEGKVIETRLRKKVYLALAPGT